MQINAGTKTFSQNVASSPEVLSEIEEDILPTVVVWYHTRNTKTTDKK